MVTKIVPVLALGRGQIRT